jgi:hypothetical protein
MRLLISSCIYSMVDLSLLMLFMTLTLWLLVGEWAVPVILKKKTLIG